MPAIPGTASTDLDLEDDLGSLSDKEEVRPRVEGVEVELPTPPLSASGTGTGTGDEPFVPVDEVDAAPAPAPIPAPELSRSSVPTPSSSKRPRRQRQASITYLEEGPDIPLPSRPSKKQKKDQQRRTSTSSPSCSRTTALEGEEEEETEYATLEPHGLGPVTTPINNEWVYLFFRFCAERHKMHERRMSGVARDQLSKDEVMKKEHIGNVYRDLDSGSKRMIEKIIPNGDQSNVEICFRVFLFCGFYSETTWQALVDGLGGTPTWKDFNLDTYESILYEKSVVQKKVIYTSGFQFVPPTIFFGKNLPNFAASLRLVKALMESGLPERLRQCRYAVDASHNLQTAPTLGGFLSLNILCYLNDSPHMKFYYRNFATCGPGSRGFLQRMFGKSAINDVAMEQAGLKWLYDNQWRYWARLGEDPPHAHTIGIRPGMRVLDFENALCWAHRYVSAYQRKGYSSLADLPAPTYDPALTEECSMPAWCDEEPHTRHTSKATFRGDYEEEALKLQEGQEGQGIYEVEKVVCRKGNRTDKDGLFRVRWKGYPPEEDTWERASSLVDGAEEAMKEWVDWEKAMWSTIDRITAENPYTRPHGVKAEEGEDVKPELEVDPESYLTPGARKQRERRAASSASKKGEKRAKSEVKPEA